MTGLLACELLHDRLDEVVTIKNEMLTGTKGTSMKLEDGDKLTILSLIYGTVCGGFNDAAYALAYITAGSHSGFVELMNKKAAELGAKNTNYSNPTGFDDPMQRTTLEDVVVIAKATLKNELYMKISSTVSKAVTFENGKADFTVHNRNGLIGSYYTSGYKNAYAKGMIAGFTDLGGYTVITSAIINDTNYLCVVMGGINENGEISSYSLANELIYYASNNLKRQCIIEKDELICTIPVKYALDGAATRDGEDYLNVRTAEDTYAVLPIDIDASKITNKYHLYSDTLCAPVKKGDIVGVIDFYLDGEIIASAPLCVNADVSANTFLVKMENAKRSMSGRTVLIPILLFIILTSLFLLFKANQKRKTVKEIKMKRYQSPKNNQKQHPR
jgi:D-alanyl-D-alanine carboxypeptidase (penicillin-binding protein 5/6)